MRVNSSNNISLAKTEKKTAAKQKRNDYYKYISQVHANDALKMSVGREVTDGKLKVAKEVTKSAGVLGLSLAYLGSTKVVSRMIDVFDKTMSLDAAQIIGAKYAKQTVACFAAASALLLSSKIIDDVNVSLADKTAKKRGFIPPLTRFKNAQAAYNATDYVYNSHINK